MPIIIRGACGLSRLFAILLRSSARLRASHITSRRNLAGALEQIGSAHIGCAGCEIQNEAGEGDER
jgi:hypothetical protein